MNNRQIPLAQWLALVLIFCSANSLFAQDAREIEQDVSSSPGSMTNQASGSNRPGADPFHLIMNNTGVQNYLQVTEDQLGHLSTLSSNFRQQMKESSFKSKEQVQEQIESGQQMMSRILSRRQLEKLNQVMLQIYGSCVLLGDRRGLEHMQLEPGSSQYRQIESICIRSNKQLMDFTENSNHKYADDKCAAQEANQKKSQEIQIVAQKQIEQLLSAPQQNILNDMKGAPIPESILRRPPCKP